MLTHFAAMGGYTNVVTISSAQQDYNLFTALGSPSELRKVLVIIEAAVIIDSSSTGNAAFSTGSGWVAGSTIRLLNNGQIIGKGGAGGAGGSSGDFYGNPGTAGGAGGDAMEINLDIEIDNTNGDIFGGGGGGGGAGGYARRATGDPEVACGGGGGGGGAGDDASSGGSGGIGNEPTDFGSPDGSAGGSGTTTAGSGGAGAQVSGEPDTRGDGGDGGEYGAAGNAGTTPAQSTFVASQKRSGAGAAGGAAGKAIELNGNSVTWLGGNNGTQVKGAVS